MNTLIDWLGKSDEITIFYDAGVPKNIALLAGGASAANLPSIVYPAYDNIRDVADVVWEDNVKKADRMDYLVAVACGAVSGLIDIFYIGEFSLERAKEWGTKETNKFVEKVAALNGFKGGDLSDAIRFLEKRFPLAADAKTPTFGGGLQHHLRDFSHHFSLGGLLCSLDYSGRKFPMNPVGGNRCSGEMETASPAKRKPPFRSVETATTRP